MSDVSIGPDAANIAPGRIVVTIAYFITLGGFAIVAGIGPLLMPSATEAKLLGGVACACGVMLLAGGIALLIRARTGRSVGIMAARAAMVPSFIGMILGASTVIGAIEPQSIDVASAVAGAILIVGCLGNGLIAVASLRAIRATRPRYFKGEVPFQKSLPGQNSTDAAAQHRVTTV